MKSRIKSLCGIFILVVVLFAGCEKVSGKTPQKKDECIGSFKNGLSYYIKENPYDQKKASLRLVVRVGSLQEEESERGLAHFLEHMVFRGSDTYSDYEVVDFLESIGASFGADTNAYTGFDQTVYMFEVPLTKEGSLEKAVSMLSEFAMKANIDDELVQKEKKVVLDELRMRTNSSQGRTANKIFETLLEHTKYGNRLPAGLDEVVEGASADQIRAFYEKWYRPENMALVAVGDFSKEEVVGYLNKYFKTLPKSKQKNIPVVPKINDYEENFVNVIKDPETMGNSFFIAQFNESNKGITEADLLENVKDQLLFSMENRRLSNLAQEANSPFKMAGFASSRFNYHSSLYYNYCVAWDEDPLKAFNQILIERKKFETTVFTPKEYDLALATSRSNLKVAIENADKQKNPAYVNAYMSHFLFGETLISFEDEAKLELKLLDSISLNDINKRKDFFAKSTNKGVLYIPPQADTTLIKEDIEISLNNYDSIIVKAESEKPLKEISLDSPFKKGFVVSREDYKSSCLSKIVLSNGVTVYFEKTDLKENLFSLKMKAKNGLTSFSEEELISAANATTYSQKSGLSGLTAVELGDALAGKTVSLNYNLSFTERVLQGSSNNEDMAYLFKMIQSVFSDLYFRDESWNQQVKMYDEKQIAKKNNPDYLFVESIPRFNYSDHYFYREFETAELNQNTSEKAIRMAFENPEEFTMIIAGDFDEEKLIENLETYIGSIPSTEKSFPEPRFSEFTIPDGMHEKVFKMGIGREASVVTNFPINFGNYDHTFRDFIKIMVFQDALKTKLQKVLRREHGETYGVHANVQFPFYPRMDSSILTIFFPTAPDKVEEMKGFMLAEMEKLYSEPLTQEEIDTSFGIYKEAKRKSLLSNDGRIQRIEGHLIFNLIPDVYSKIEDYEDEFKQEAFNKEVLKVIDLENRIFHIKVPESSEYK